MVSLFFVNRNARWYLPSFQDGSNIVAKSLWDFSKKPGALILPIRVLVSS